MSGCCVQASETYKCSGSSGSDPCIQNIKQQTTYPEPESRDADELGGTNYSFEYSQSDPDGHQVQINFSHASHYSQTPSSNFQCDQRNQFTRKPNYLNPLSTNMNLYDRFTSNTSSQLEATSNHGYFTGYPRSVYIPLYSSLEHDG